MRPAFSEEAIGDVARQFATLTEDRPDRFARMARAVFAYQRTHNAVYRRLCDASEAEAWPAVPFLPVEAFKRAPVVTFPPAAAEAVFESSGTGRGVASKHYVRRLAVYERAVTAHFEAVFGRGPFTLVAHLPGYAERGHRSSLVYMAETLVRRYGGPGSGFFLEDLSGLERAVEQSLRSGTRLLLVGAAFGLLDLVETAGVALPHDALVIETGGMKTYRREVDRTMLHQRLAEGFGLPEAQIWSEYGMCELMSQCYTRGGAVFYPPPWMRFHLVDPEDPRRPLPEGRPGAIALFDLANVYSAAAVLTEDLGVQRGVGFEVLGRLSKAALRGCNFLVEPPAQED